MKKSEFIEKCSNPKLFKAILKQGGISWSELKERPEDFYDASSGSVNGIIYYEDTTKFAKKYLFEILEQLEEFERDCGQLEKPSASDKTQYLNWLTWFAWENMMSELMSFLDR